MSEVLPYRPEPERNAPITPMQMLQIAIERGADLAQLEKLMDLQDRYEKSEARKAFVSALAEFKANPPEIEKTKPVSFGSGTNKTAYKHATLDHVSDAIGMGLSKHGLSHRWDVEQEGNNIRVSCILTHVLGHSEQVSLTATPDTSGSKNSIQAIGSTVTYLQRYTLLAATGLAAKDQDNDATDAESINADQKAEIITLMREVNADTKAFLKYLGVASLDVLPAARFDHAISALKQKARK